MTYIPIGNDIYCTAGVYEMKREPGHRRQVARARLLLSLAGQTTDIIDL
jgi:hypothetical protein